MESDFWNKKWQANEIGFHLPEVHPLLDKYAKQVFEESTTVFVPLCGKSKDVSYLHSKNYSVIANELSELAIRSFFLENFSLSDIQLKTINQKPLKIFEHSSIQVFVGDFFSLEPDCFSDVGNVYDRAALVALPEAMRDAYVQKLKQLFPSAKLFLITLDYDQKITSGPPFSVTHEEVSELFSFAKVKQVSRRNIIDKEPRFKSRGLLEFFESAYLVDW